MRYIPTSSTRWFERDLVPVGLKNGWAIVNPGRLSEEARKQVRASRLTKTRVVRSDTNGYFILMWRQSSLLH